LKYKTLTDEFFEIEETSKTIRTVYIGR